MIFILSTRHIKNAIPNSQYSNEPGKAHYLALPCNATSPDPNTHQLTQEQWIKKLTQDATTGHHPNQHPLAQFKTGNILFFVHGYNNSQEEVIQRHKLLDTHLKQHGFTGTIVSFDWPCATYTLNYLEERIDGELRLKVKKADIPKKERRRIKEWE